MNKTLSHLFIALFGILQICSCDYEPIPGNPRELMPETVEVDLRCIDAATASTKSSLGTSETAVSNADIFVFDASSGILDQAVYCNGGTPSLSLVKGHKYNIYVLANVGDVTSAVKASFAAESAFAAGYRHSFASFGSITAYGFPMASRGGVPFTGGSSASLSVPVDRMVARYNVKVDRSALSGSTLTVKSVSVRQNALSFLPFGSAGERFSTSVCNGDSASASDISTLNAGGTVTFYVLENRQGVLLPSNGDPWAKVPGNISSRKDCCTYLEMVCSYSSDSRRCDNATYRMYLGADATKDFNVTRNSVYTLTLRPTDAGSGTVSWKIDPGDVLTYTHELVISPSSAAISIGGTQTYSATRYTYTWTNGVRNPVPTGSQTVSASYSSGNTSVATVSGSVATGKGVGSTAITGSYAGLSATSTLTVGDAVSSYDTPSVSVSYSPSTVAAAGGTATPSVTYSQTVHYASGATATLTSGGTVSFSGSASGFTLSPSTGSVTAEENDGAERSITVTATVTLNGKSGSATASVSQEAAEDDWTVDIN